MTVADPVHGGEADRWGGWSWRPPARGEHFRRCSYCGSVHPEDLAAEIQWRAEWADMKYGWPHKFYVALPNRDPGMLFVSGSINRPDAKDLAAGYVLVDELTEEQRAIAERDGARPLTPGHAIQFGTRASHFGKFYTRHLADPELPPGVKEAIEQRSGLRFEFMEDGMVRWRAAAS